MSSGVFLFLSLPFFFFFFLCCLFLCYIGSSHKCFSFCSTKWPKLWWSFFKGKMVPLRHKQHSSSSSSSSSSLLCFDFFHLRFIIPSMSALSSTLFHFIPKCRREGDFCFSLLCWLLYSCSFCSLSLSLSLSLSTWLFDTGKGTTHTLEDHIFGSKIWANWIWLFLSSNGSQLLHMSDWKGNDVASFTLYYAYRIYKDFQNKISNLSTHLLVWKRLRSMPVRVVLQSLATTKKGKLGVTKFVMWDFQRLLLVSLIVIPFSFWVTNLFSQKYYTIKETTRSMCRRILSIICWQTNIQIFNAMCGPKLCNENKKKVCDVVKLKSLRCANAHAR